MVGLYIDSLGATTILMVEERLGMRLAQHFTNCTIQCTKSHRGIKISPSICQYSTSCIHGVKLDPGFKWEAYSCHSVWEYIFTSEL